MYTIANSRAVPVTGEALIDAVMLTCRLIIRQDQRASTDHLLDTQAIHHQRLVVFCPPIPRPYVSLLTLLVRQNLED